VKIWALWAHILGLRIYIYKPEKLLRFGSMRKALSRFASMVLVLPLGLNPTLVNLAWANSISFQFLQPSTAQNLFEREAVVPGMWRFLNTFVTPSKASELNRESETVQQHGELLDEVRHQEVIELLPPREDIEPPDSELNREPETVQRHVELLDEIQQLEVLELLPLPEVFIR
jgi:hypothetical protein